ncbi:MAG: hypothetical protein ATN35_11605 [Epulopiscium sp. Nele67-Bin004]|nr:MAG: hypothetical protein ATN35_11605 [Epulopiscium sp. Nele67-Bin004]
MDNYDELKSKYKDGYRCIYSEGEGEDLTLHLKNFEKEKICTISSNQKMEIGEMENFLDAIDVQKAQGYDTICTQDECERPN